ncbi:MAG: Ribosomal RNA small subunit methyltransferase I [Microgenomates group bacterium GW2011_GWB1_40_9]|nr:MAG: Ribosomal RNA small subunit methyltransferase I [Microgenomates group bacterium GW2011_GWC1_39_12]KKR80064.1 MAG: Ribosomal RNA small subunit methyltransferase I [Microgenomates group bacterium GW2011_GWB1_40_9]
MGTLFIVSTPIGNLADITIRALETLFRVAVIACEDTRQTGQLLHLLQERYAKKLTLPESHPKLLSYRNQNEETVACEIATYLQRNQDVALVSDAGTPLISDPGYRIVKYCTSHAISITVVGGVSASIQALVGSGMPVDKFTFLGFLPEKQGHRMTLLRSLLQVPFTTTYIIYVAPHKLKTTLEEIKECYGNDQMIGLAHELTKIHESYWTGTVEKALMQTIKGEYVLLLPISLHSPNRK